MRGHDVLVLAVVAFVGIVAMASMSYAPAQEKLTGDFIPLTARAAVEYSQLIPEPIHPDFDYSGDGVLSKADAILLADYILEQRCPTGKTCDLNNDLRLTMRDLEILNAMIVAWAPKQSAPVVAQYYRAVRVPSTVGSRLA